MADLIIPIDYDHESVITDVTDVTGLQSVKSSSSSHIYEPLNLKLYSESNNSIPEISYSQQPVLNKKNWYWPSESKYQTTYLLISIICSLTMLSLEIYVFYEFSLINGLEIVKRRSLETYLGLFIGASLYQLIISYMAIWNKNVCQLYLLLLFLLLMIIYSVLQFVELGNYMVIKPSMIVIIVMLSITFIIESVLIYYKLQGEINWDNYRNIGASLARKRQYLQYQFYNTILLFDSFFLPGFTLQFIIINLPRSDPEFYITILILPLTILILLFLHYSLHRNIIWGLYLCILSYLTGLAYVIFKIVRLYTYLKYDPHGYLPGRKSLTLFGVITIILLIITILLTWLVKSIKRDSKSEIGVFID